MKVLITKSSVQLDHEAWRRIEEGEDWEDVIEECEEIIRDEEEEEWRRELNEEEEEEWDKEWEEGRWE
jgi:hypothetical protein